TRHHGAHRRGIARDFGRERADLRRGGRTHVHAARRSANAQHAGTPAGHPPQRRRTMSMLRRTGSGLLFLVTGAIRSIAGNLGLAALSLALALSLWLFVTDKENPIQAQTFNSSISVDLV